MALLKKLSETDLEDIVSDSNYFLSDPNWQFIIINEESLQLRKELKF